MPYDIPNFHVEYVRAEPPAVPTGFWRGVGPNNNVFAVECFMDELARKAGKDPVDFRRSMLGNQPRFLAALNLAAEKSNWGEPLPARVGRGVCVQPSFASFIATVVEAEVDEHGEVLLRRVISVVDTGIAVNPDTVVAQLEGGLIFGLTAALYGEITIDKGRVQQSNFNDYRMLRIDQVPKIEVHVVKSGEPPGGIGETGANATGVPAQLVQANVVERGAYLARAADCMVCHTTQGGKEYAGGLGFKLPFGTLYSTNITPDKETGIGNYSDQDFLNAIHRGIREDGARLYPAMPFTSYSYMTDEDVLAIKAYLFSLSPVHAEDPENTLKFPFNQRWAMGFWSALFNPDARFAPDTSKSPQWNRGAYLAEALAHCGECHTPRNLAFALDNRQKFAGALTAGWRAFNISSDKTTGVGAWRDDDLVSYLSIGHADGHGTASGPMGEAVDHSLSKLAPEDIRAVV